MFHFVLSNYFKSFYRVIISNLFSPLLSIIRPTQKPILNTIFYHHYAISNSKCNYSNLIQHQKNYNKPSPMTTTTMENLSVKILQEIHLDDGARILTKNFISSNPVWKNYNLPYDDIFVIMRGKLIKALEYDQSFVLYEGDKIIGVTVHLDMLDYVSIPAMPNNLEFFKKLSKVGEALQGSVDLSKAKRGQVVVGVFGVIDPDYASKGYSLKFWWQCVAIGKATGWKTYYSRASNIYSRKGLERLGAEIVKQYELVDGEVKEKFWLMKMNLTKPALAYSKLKEIMEQKKNPKPKL